MQNLIKKGLIKYGFPEDVVYKIPRITWLGLSSVFIENIEGILEYGMDKIRLKTILGIITIGGQNMIIENITEYSILIRGEIKAIVYQ